MPIPTFKKFKNITLSAKSNKINSNLATKIDKSMDDLESSFAYIIGDKDKSDLKKAKDIRTMISASNDLISMHISDELKISKTIIDSLEERKAPESTPEDVVVLGYMLKQGITPNEIQKNPELANIIVNSKYGAYLFGEDVANMAKETSFKFNLGTDYEKYIDAKKKSDLAEEYATQIGEYLNGIEQQVSNQ